MRVDADTSFIVKLLSPEPGTVMAVDLYRQIGRPPIYFLSLHGLEVANAVRQRTFHQRRTQPASERTAIKSQRDASLSLLSKWIARRTLVEVNVDLDAAIFQARSLSEKHTEHLGCRGFDLLHVALALELECETFLTSDRVKGAVAGAEGLDSKICADEWALSNQLFFACFMTAPRVRLS
jgi:predicted nucleic acid-binding protein